MGSSSPKVPVTDYTMSVHLGICAGPIDAFLSIYTGEKLAWSGEITAEDTQVIRNVDLYGGPKKEGGVEGTVRFMPGGPAQLMPDILAAKFGLTSATCPAYRGIASIFFYGGFTTPDPSMDPELRAAVFRVLGLGSLPKLKAGQRTAFVQGKANGVKGKPGFYWQSNNPQIKTIWAKVRRAPVGLLTENALIQDLSQQIDSNSVTQTVVNYDANPSHMVYECLTNTDWGLGLSSAAIHTDSFLDSAITLFNESFGLSLMWVKASTIEDMVSEIIDHIQATIYVDPKDGLIHLKLLRNDYVAEDAELFDPTNCLLNAFARKAESECINEITVTYTNPFNEEESTLTQQNLAGITAAGGIVHDDRNYYGIRNVNLAAFALARDLRSAAIPLAKTEMITSRKGWTKVPGDVIRISYPEHRLNKVVFRVGAIDYGKPGDYAVRIQLVEDVFGFDPGAYSIPGPTQWVDPSQLPDPFEQQQAFTVPFVLSKLIMDEATLGEDSLLGVLGGTENPDAYAFDLQTETEQTDGTLGYGYTGTLSPTAHAILGAELPAEGSTVIAAFPTVSEGPSPIVGGFMILGSGADEDREWVYIREAIDDSNSVEFVGYQLDRGILDTTPRTWPVGTEAWFLNPSVIFYDTNLWAPGADVNYKLLMRTSLGMLDESQADVLVATASERPQLPYRPADVKVEGVAFNDEETPVDATLLSTVTVDWAIRNRDSEDADILTWTDAGVTPPAGQTTTVSVLGLDGTVWATHDALAGSTYELAVSDFTGPIGRVRVTSKLGGLESLQGHEIYVRAHVGGYGFDYGSNYGGI